MAVPHAAMAMAQQILVELDVCDAHDGDGLVEDDREPAVVGKRLEVRGPSNQVSRNFFAASH